MNTQQLLGGVLMPSTGKKMIPWSDLTNPIVREIIALRKLGYGLRSIGEALRPRAELSGEGVRKGLERIKRIHGPSILLPDQQEWKATEASLTLKQSRFVIITLCGSGVIRGCRHISKKDPTWLISKEGREELRQYFSKSRKRTCGVCGKTFSASTKNSRIKTCSKTCEEKWKKMLFERITTCDPDQANMKDTTKKAWDALRKHRERVQTHRWVTIADASSKTGVSRAKIRWYIVRKILAKKKGPAKNGKTNRQFILCDLLEIKTIAPILAK